MSVKSELYDVLRRNSSVAALAGDRVYPLRIPLNVALPAVTYAQEESSVDRTQEGLKITQPRFKLECWGTTFDDSQALGDAVVAALDRSHPTPSIRSAQLDDDSDDVDLVANTHVRILTFALWI